LVSISSQNINFYVQNKIECTPEILYSIAYSLLQEDYLVTIKRYTYAIQLFQMVASKENNAEQLISVAQYILNKLNAFYCKISKDVAITPQLNKAIENVVLAKLKYIGADDQPKKHVRVMAEMHYHKRMNELKQELIIATQTQKKSSNPPEQQQETPRKVLKKLNQNFCNFWFVPHVHGILNKDHKISPSNS
jgi:hypothetical protein